MAQMKDIPLVLIHGYPFDHTLWFSTVASLGANARVLAPDLPGFGRTELPADKKPSMEAMARSVAMLLNDAGKEKAVVAGMSMGGYVALAFAEKYRERLAGLALVSSQTAADSAEAKQLRQETIQRIRAEGVNGAVEAMLPKMFSPEKFKDSELVAYPKRAAQAAGPDGLCWALQAMADRPDRTRLARELSVPVLVVHGAEDKIVPCARARMLAESCQDPIYVEIAGAGHATPLEAPDQVAAALARLMKRVRETAAAR